jgi:Resolvase, N terminal domain
MIYGYARVSTDGQSVDAQVHQLRAAGAGRVFREVASGAKTDRAQLRRFDGDARGRRRSARDEAQPACTIDARSPEHHCGHHGQESRLPVAWRFVGRHQDTARPTDAHRPRRAEFERDLIRARTGEGRERAKARGVKLGRKPKLTLHQKREAIRRRRTTRRYRSHFQCEPEHDFAADGTMRTFNVISS